MKILTSSLIFLLGCVAPMHAAEPDFHSRFLSVGLSRANPGFSFFAVDSLGRGNLASNPVLAETNSAALQGLELDGRFAYRLNGKPIWRITCGEKLITLHADFVPGLEAPPLVLEFNQKANHATLLGRMRPGQRQVALPCVLHLPDMGSVRISANVSHGQLDYDARRWQAPAPFVRVAFPAATAQQARVQYRLEVAAIYPKLAGLEKDARYDGFRRDFLNIFQLNPRVQMLANNASSDPVPFTLFLYSEVALYAPPLARGLTALDLVRMTLDRYLAGAKGYGQVGYACEPTDADLIPWKTPWTSSDTLPSLLIAAGNYVQSAKDWPWASANYGKLLGWANEMMAADHDGNGLIEYPGSGNYGDRPLTDKRPSNWWDTINFGHEDAYANALALDPSSEAVTGLANIYMRSGRLPEADVELRKLVAAHPDQADPRIQLGRVLAAEGKNDDAIAELQAAVKLAPADVSLQRDLADLYVISKKYDQAEAAYRGLLAGSPNDAELHQSLGKALLEEKKFADAQKEFLAAVSLKPDLGTAYGDLAFAASENKDYPLTIKALDARVKYLPDEPVTYFLRASAYDHLKDVKQAAVNYHLFLNTAHGKYPDQEWQAKHRLIAIEPKR